MYCVNCGKQLMDGSKFCPECGTPQRVTPPASQSGTPQSEPQLTASAQNTYSPNADPVKKAPYNTMSIIGLVVSGISLFLNFAGLVGIAGTVLSVLGLMGCNQKNENGKPLALIGIVIGGFSILYGLIMVLKW